MFSIYLILILINKCMSRGSLLTNFLGIWHYVNSNKFFHDKFLIIIYNIHFYISKF